MTNLAPPKKHHLNIQITAYELEEFEKIVGKSYGAKTRIMRILLRKFIQSCKDKETISVQSTKS